ncbi:unnamed protein product [Didymodactylos carnosus]|uniref:Peptidase S1 domain-containing protein n=1 Tax=Didymodactylos carnosus TaxID=1234261 RepID=A0A814UEJ9_9BILA|nr:unnamed protein product [Didymodactylos carnosus]CAF3934859.1 unnamed protein product [Didymodactylos carnosus]
MQSTENNGLPLNTSISGRQFQLLSFITNTSNIVAPGPETIHQPKTNDEFPTAPVKSHFQNPYWILPSSRHLNKNNVTVLPTKPKFDYESSTLSITWNSYYPNVESTVQVLLGIHSRKNEVEALTVQASEAIKHPLFSKTDLLNDIAIIKLKEFINPSPNIQFACLENTPSTTVPEAFTTGFVVGWGDTSYGSNRGSNVLQQTNVTVYPESFCSNVSPSNLKNWNSQICCGDLQGMRDACQGDSGGGLYIKRYTTDNNRFYVDGIVSYGEQCAIADKPGIYARTSYYLDWIRQSLDFN